MSAPIRLAAISLLFIACAVRAAEKAVPADVFDLSQWKLQIPVPMDVKDLKGHSSGFFSMDAGELHFHLDASEQGATPNTPYVRSELRHLPEWRVSDTHTLSGEFRVVSTLTPDKVTALQIHGVAADGGNAPPLLRIAVNAGDLVAALKSDDAGKTNDMIALKKQLGSQWVKVEIKVKDGQLTITVDGDVKLTRNLAYWPHRNYFKAGCYPQAKQGAADVYFRSLHAE